MYYVTRRKTASLFLILFVLFSFAASDFSARAAPVEPQVEPEALSSESAPRVVVRAGYTDSPALRVPPPPEFSVQGVKGATITVNYNGTWDAQAQAAFQYAVDIWASQLDSSVEIVVEAYWSSLPQGVLGSAGPANFYRNFTGAPMSNTWYPQALANALAGADLNGPVSEIQAEFNKNFSYWYFGTDGSTPGDRWDFATVVLHELCHGLGFIGSMDVTSGIGSWGFGTNSPLAYDLFTENGAGQSLINDFPNNSAALAAQLQSDDLYFDGTNANAANGGSRPELYAPSPWNSGSSYSHLGEAFNSTPNALMTYAVNNGEVNHNPGSVTRGMFQDMGWTLASVQPKLPDLNLEMSVVGGADHDPGDTVTFYLYVENEGQGAATNVVLTDLLPTGILTPTWSASPSLAGTTARSGSAFVWDLPDLAAGDAGTVTVQGVIDPALPSDFALVNEASISTDLQEPDENDNDDAALVGGVQIYLPLALRNN